MALSRNNTHGDDDEREDDTVLSGLKTFQNAYLYNVKHLYWHLGRNNIHIYVYIYIYIYIYIYKLFIEGGQYKWSGFIHIFLNFYH